MQGQGRCQSGSHCWRGRGQGILDAQWGTRQWTAAQCQTQQSTSSSCGTAGLCPPLCFPVHREREVQVGMVDSKADSASQSACTSMTQTGIDTVSKAKQKPRKPPLLLPLFFFFPYAPNDNSWDAIRVNNAFAVPCSSHGSKGKPEGYCTYTHTHACKKTKTKTKKKPCTHDWGGRLAIILCVCLVV